MSAHTPGPWSVGYLDNNSQRVVSGPYFEVATLWHHSVGSIEKEMEANATLIAAAPELLEAADEALNVLIGCCIPASGADDRKAILRAQSILRAVIAKATGAGQ